MNAGRILRAAGYDSDALKIRLAPVDPDTVNVWPASSLFSRFWRKGVEGVTYWKFVFVDAEVMRGDPQRLARLVIHELVHVRQYMSRGYLSFVVSYAMEYLRGRLSGMSPHEAYRAISHEREAREMTAQTERLM